jgi:hypothetical protein
LCASKSRQLKKIFLFIVLYGFLTGLGGYFFIFKLQQHINYHQISERINRRQNKDIADVLVFNVGNEFGVKWIKKHKEFIYRDQLYDIVSRKVSGNKVFYYCINDIKEKKLISDFEKNNRTNKRANQVLRKITQFQFILSSPSFNTFNPIIPCCFRQLTCQYISPINNTLSPPPKQIQIA